MSETSVLYATWKTKLRLSVRAPQTPALRDWLDELLHDEVDNLDALASRFRADSQLASINRGAGTWTPASWDFVTVLTASLTAAGATEGLVSPLLGAELVSAGYDKWAGQDSGIPAGRSVHDWADIEIRPGRSQAEVRIPAGSALDLGAVAKAWLADRVATIAHTSTGFDTMANMGGDLRVISPSRPWLVAADPDVAGIEPSAFEVEDAGLATSGIGKRAWAQGHHIIDPRTGDPARTCWQSVSVMAMDAAGANTAATAGMILGDAGPAWMAGMGLDGWFVGDAGRLVQTVGRWPVADHCTTIPA